MKRADILNYGGGKQSVAICVLIVQGKLPKPERIQIANTGRENPATFEYMERHTIPLLASVSLTIDVVGDGAEPSLYAPGGQLLIPAYDVAGGKLRAFCSGEWKRDVLNRSLRAAGYGPKRPVRQWIGISVDEIGRAVPSRKRWIEHHYPLLSDLPMRREDCVRLVRQFGLPEPPKSSCFMCPHMRNDQWVELRRAYPATFAKAVTLDEQIRRDDKRGGVYLHDSRLPLAEVDFSPAQSEEPSLFGPTSDCGVVGCFI
jgi:hypothetical protein